MKSGIFLVICVNATPTTKKKSYIYHKKRSFMKRFTLMTVMLMSVAFSYAKTLVLYYSFTNNS